jgi:hypothetical protein
MEEIRQESPNSGGPGSKEGTAAPRLLECKSSIHAQEFVIPGEDPAELEALIHSYSRSYVPGTALEWFLVDSLIVADWEMRRVRKVQMQVLQQEMKKGATLQEIHTESPGYQRLERRRAAVERSFYRAFKELEKILAREEKEEAKRQKAEGQRVTTTLAGTLKSASLDQKRGSRERRGELDGREPARGLESAEAKEAQAAARSAEGPESRKGNGFVVRRSKPAWSRE